MELNVNRIHDIIARERKKGYLFGSDIEIDINGSVSIIGSVEISNRYNKLPFYFKEVSGSFNCSNPRRELGLTSLKGCPEKVGLNFNCSNNILKSLRYCPKEVGGNFMCSSNNLKSLEFCPEKVGGSFVCINNKLESLEFGPKEVGGGFICSDNDLKSLKGCPEKINGHFNCSSNNIKSLEFCPKEISGDFNFSDNEIINFDGLPEFFESRIEISGNPVFEIYQLFNRDPKCIYWIREFDVIQGNKIIKDRLDEVYVHMNKVMPKNIVLKEYRLI